VKNTDTRQYANPEANQPGNDRRFGFIVHIKRKLHEHKTKKENEDPVDRAARLTAKATVWIACFTVVMALVGVGTLYEIIEGGTDTHDLAVAAGKQADKMSDMFTAADEIRGSAQRMVQQERRIADAAQSAIQASNRQSLANLQSLRNDQRAWVSAIPSTLSGASLVGGIPAAGQLFGVRINFRNSGKTPAMTTRTCLDWGIRQAGQAPQLHCSSVQHGVGIVPPGGTIFTDGLLFVNTPVNARETILQEKEVVWVWGWSTYDDVFGRDHRTDFCYYLLSGGGWAVCDQNNNMD
jgi:hypothetical protein